MHVAALRMELRLADCNSRRQKRRLMFEILEKLRRNFNVSLAEVDRDDQPALAVLGISAVALSRREARETVERVAEAVGAHPLIEVVGLVLHEL